MPPPPPLLLWADDRPVAPVEVAGTRRARRRGLLGRGGLAGALWLPATASVHTLGMRFAIDVARLDATGTVVDVAALAPGSVTWWRWGVTDVVEAEAGSLARWGVAPGARLAVGPIGQGSPTAST